MLAHGGDMQFLVVNKNRGEKETRQYSIGNQSLPVGSWRSRSLRFFKINSNFLGWGIALEMLFYVVR